MEDFQETNRECHLEAAPLKSWPKSVREVDAAGELRYLHGACNSEPERFFVVK